MTAPVAQLKAQSSAKIAAGLNALVPGRTINSMPTTPSPSMTQRQGGIFSPRTRVASNVMIRGEEKLVAVASAIGIRPNAMMKTIALPNIARPRKQARPGRLVTGARPDAITAIVASRVNAA